MTASVTEPAGAAAQPARPAAGPGRSGAPLVLAALGIVFGDIGTSPLTVRQTSPEASGQIYLPGINAALFVGVLALMLTFRSSQRLATAYGVSVTGALVVDTMLLLVVARMLWQWQPWKLVLAAVVFGGVETTFLSANQSKVTHGGWIPLLIATVVFVLMTTWQRGREIVQENRRAMEGSLDEFVNDVRVQRLPRVPGTAVFPHPSKETTPLALRANTQHNRVLHEAVVIVTATAENVPYIPTDEKFRRDELGLRDDGIQHLYIRFGFSEKADLLAALRQAVDVGALERPTDLDDLSFFISRGSIRLTPAPGMARWRKELFITLAHNAADPAAVFGLPADRTVTMGSDVEL